jgi:nicotinate-nucleotide adenylyltransferase
MNKIKPVGKTGNIGVFFGSFNPITDGHIHVAEASVGVEQDGVSLDELWYCVSPHNPHKWKKGVLALENHRWEMTQKTVEELGNPKIHATNIEFFQETKPSFTHHTLMELQQDNPDAQIFIVCGTDTHHKIQIWESGKWIHKTFKFWVFPRDGEHKPVTNEILHSNSYYLDAITTEASSTAIRDAIRDGDSIDGMTSKSVVDYIDANKVYDFVKKKNV